MWRKPEKNETQNERINGNVSKGISESLNGRKAGRHWETLVGYTLDELMRHLESKFEGWMTWENYGEWHIDHIIPKAYFNFTTTDDIEFKQCWALSNLQPLEASENKRKGAKLPEDFQPSLAMAGQARPVK